MLIAGLAGQDHELASSKQNSNQPGAPRRKSSVKPVPDARTRGVPFNVDYRLLARFRYELRKFQAFSATAARSVGLTPQQHQALLIVRGFSGDNPVSVGDIAKYLLIRHHTAVELVNRMVRLDLIIRIVDQSDGRRVFVEATQEGERRLQKLSRINSQEIRSIGPALTGMLKAFRRL